MEEKVKKGEERESRERGFTKGGGQQWRIRTLDLEAASDVTTAQVLSPRTWRLAIGTCRPSSETASP